MHAATRRTARACLLLLGLVASASPARGDEPPEAAERLTGEERAFFRWWDGLGYPDVGSLPFGRLWRGMWVRSGDADPTQKPEGAFLVGESEGRFTVFQTDLRTVTYEATGPETKPWDRIAFEREDLAAHVTSALELISKEGPEISWFEKFDPFNAHEWASPNHAFRILVLARALAARGREDLAHALCEKARSEETPWWILEHFGREPSGTSADFEDLKASIRAESRVALQEAYLDETVSWEEILARTEWWTRAFSPADLETEDGEVAILRAMVADRRAREARPRKAPEEQTPEERLAVLVLDLPDDLQFWSTLWGDAPWRPKDSPTGPGDRLVEAGLPAVPFLLDALNDGRPTRTVLEYDTMKGQFRPSFEVLTVGEVAWSLLNRISGGRLQRTPAGGPPTSGQPSRRQVAEAWYAAVRDRGEVAVLAEDVAAAGPGARDAAARLAGIDPASAVTALETGILAAGEESDARGSLVRTLAAIPGEVSTPALLRLLPSLSSSEAGLPVAQALWSRGRREGLDDLIRRWRALTAPDAPPGSSSAGDDLGASLARTENLEAVAALSDGLSRLDPHERIAVLQAFSPAWELEGAGITRRRTTEDAAVLEAIEALLAGRLEDGERAEGLYLGIGPVGKEPVVGEIAATVLAARDPSRWTFDARASAGAREEARIALANAWRARKGEPPLPAPERRAAPEPLPRAALEPHLVLAATDPDPVVRKAALSALETKGLPAVPALREALGDIVEPSPGRNALAALATRLSFRVVEAGTTENSLPLPPALTAALADAKDRTFSGDLFYRFWTAFAAHAPAPGTVLILNAERERAEVGVRLSLTLTTSKAPPNPDPGLSFDHPWVRRREGRAHGGVGWFPVSVGARENAWEGSEKELQAEIDATALDDTFEAEGRIESQR